MPFLEQIWTKLYSVVIFISVLGIYYFVRFQYRFWQFFLKMKDQIEFVPRSDGIKIYEDNGICRVSLHLYALNFFPYLDLELQPLRIDIDDKINCISESFILKRSSLTSVEFRAILNSDQGQWLKEMAQDKKDVRINGTAKLSFFMSIRKIEKGFTLEGVRVK